MDINAYLLKYGVQAKSAARKLSIAGTDKKNSALKNAAQILIEKENDIIKANRLDVEKAINNGMSQAMTDRLTLNHDRIIGMSEGLMQLTKLSDPIGETVEGWVRPNGLEILKKRVPLGVIGIIFESRPNVTADAAGLCIKSGNACILRGGSEAINSNLCISSIFSEALKEAGLPEACVNLIDNTDREIVNALMKLNAYIDVLIPRGGAGLIKSVIQNSTVPVIQTGTGNCHIYVDESADLNMAKDIIINAKVQRPSVCNAVETILISGKVAEEFLPIIANELINYNVELRCCQNALKYLEPSVYIKKATEDDWATEYNDLILAVKIVDSIDDAIEHISKYGTLHSESIITRSLENAKRFQNEVDAACVYVNSSTRFTDGFEFGFGAEIGISNQKLHARGPMGLKELTTTKYIINGNGQIRK